MNTIAQAVLDFWFTPQALAPDEAGSRMAMWFSQNADFDYDVERRFGKLVSMAAKGGFDSWGSDPKSNLALILLLDQFPRNLYRGSAKAFATDSKALTLTKQAFDRGDTEQLSVPESIFLLMPFQHSENLDDQQLGIQRYEALSKSVPPEWAKKVEGVTEFARRHCAVIEQFGRFPHRNTTLGRETTDAERTYLESGGDTF